MGSLVKIFKVSKRLYLVYRENSSFSYELSKKSLLDT